jgi:starch synthase
MKIFFPLVEFAPIAYTGDLGLYNSNIIEQLKTQDNEIYVSLPFYKNMDLSDFIYQSSFKENILGYECEFIKCRKNNINFYLIRNQYFLDRENIYGYNDDVYRFSFYTYCIAYLIKTLIDNIDIVSISDWHISLLPLLFEIKKINIPVVLSIFDLKFQGITDKNLLYFLNIDPEYYYWGFLEFYEQVNNLKSGLLLTKRVIFNSNLYLNQLIEYDELSFGLSGVIKVIQSKCCVVGKGIDNSYNPEFDNLIEFNFTSYDLSGKTQCKTSLQKELSFPIHTEIPLVVIPSKYIEEDEVWILNSIIPYLIRMEIQIIILGNRLADFEKNIKELSFRLNCSVISVEDTEENLRKVMSASDIFLDVSTESYNDQLIKIALNYGVLPIVMSDSPDIDIEHNRFRIFNFTPDDLINTIKYTINKYYDMDKWNEKVKKIMSYDFSWQKASKEYLKIYSETINNSK